jgi:hypothetical protein
MTISNVLINNPRKPDESANSYIRRVVNENPTLNFDSVRRVYYKYKDSKFVIVQKKLVNGQVVSETHKLKPKSFLEVDLPIKRVSTNLGSGQQWVIQEKDTRLFTLDDVKELVNNSIDIVSRSPIKLNPSKKFEKKALFNIITDVHAGMDVKEGFLDYEWNSKLLLQSFESNYQKLQYLVNIHGKVDKLYLMDLGDTLDGYEGLTTRGGHLLPQNMTSEQQFSLVLNTYLSYIENLLKDDLCDTLIIYRTENDNHAGSFGKLLGMTLEAMVTRLYPKAKVKFVRQTKFIDTLQYGENYFLPTHGKDEKYMKANMPLTLNGKWIDYINSVIKRYSLLGKNVSVFKGDLHQLAMSSQTLFKYYNFPAFSPPSGWAQHNFGAPNDIGYAMHLYSEDGKVRETVNETFDFH